MSINLLEKRVARLEEQMKQLQEDDEPCGQSAKSWRRAIEKFAGDEDLQSIFAEAQKLRELDRKRVHQRRPRSGIR
jgi:hypothetical protein